MDNLGHGDILNKSSIKPIKKKPIESNNMISNFPKSRFKSLFIIKKNNEAKIPKKIPNPPIRGSGILFCFLLSTKSNILLFRANLFIRGNEINEIKNAIKVLEIIKTKFQNQPYFKIITCP